MSTASKTLTAFSNNDDILFHPETYICPLVLNEMVPFQIFTGFGFILTILDNHLDAHSWNFYSKAQLDKFIRQLEKDDIYTIEECFFAYAVKQNNDDPFKHYIEKA